MVVHAKSKRRISYGDVVKFAKVPAELPKIAEATSRSQSQFRLIGRKDIGRVDVPLEGQRHRQVRHRRAGAGHGLRLAAARADGRRQGRRASTPTRSRRSRASRHVLSLPFGVAVVGDTVEASRAGRNALKVELGHERRQGRAVRLREGARRNTPARPRTRTPRRRSAFKVGDADKALAGAAKTLEAAYWSEHTYHAQMEPMNAVAKVSDDGQSAEIWVGTQVQPLAAARGRGRAQDHAGQDQDQPATARRRLRPAHLAGRPGAGGGDRPTSSRSR